MPQKDFLAKLKEGYEKNYKISEAKNSDYAGSEDAFKNFRACELLGVDSNLGILVRITDKLMRISNLLERDAKVKDESINDTLADLANYAMILSIKIEHENA